MRMLISPNTSIQKLACSYPFELTMENFACIFNNSHSPIEYTPDEDYVQSYYNYACRGEKKVAVYNTLYSSLAILSYEEYDCLCMAKTGTSELKKLFVENGLWISKKTNEKDFFITCSEYLDSLSNGNVLTLAVTHKCNARCNYCYEEGIQISSMDDRIIDGVVNFVSSLGNCIQINWFGGEPLLNTYAIDEISNKIRDKKIDFRSYLITNGSLIDDNTIELMVNKWNVKDVQISIDGQEEDYLKIKNYVDDAEYRYYIILSNIIKLAKAGIFVHIRINISRENIEQVGELQRELEYVFSEYENIILYPAFISGSGYPFSEKEMIQLVADMMKNSHNVVKLTADTKLFSLPRMHSCAAQDKNAFTIDSDGYIYKCEHLVGIKGKAIGSIFDLKNVNNLVTREISAKCKNCIFLPKCMGGCKANRNTGDIPCFIEKYIIMGYMKLISS